MYAQSCKGIKRSPSLDPSENPEYDSDERPQQKKPKYCDELIDIAPSSVKWRHLVDNRVVSEGTSRKFYEKCEKKLLSLPELSVPTEYDYLRKVQSLLRRESMNLFRFLCLAMF